MANASTGVPDLSGLMRWLVSWVQPGGEIFGFHNHSVWGGNPMRWNDWTSGHSTWASPLMVGLAGALRQKADPRGVELLRRLVPFQATSFRDDGSGNFRHIGFQIGERCKIGLIHNAIACVSMLETLLLARDHLDSDEQDLIRRAVLANTPVHGPADPRGVCNQEYARVWAKLLFTVAFPKERGDWRDAIPGELDALVAFHVPDVPSQDAIGCRRVVSDRALLEPAEYYGLMILPLVLAYEVYRERRFLDQAKRMARHVVESAWRDERDAARMHRLWYARDNAWERQRTPMLIAGMGDSLRGVERVVGACPDSSAREFLVECDRTYAVYQHPVGFFQSASGWDSEVDVAPSSAWHAHDAAYLLQRHEVDQRFWDTVFTPDPRTAVLLGSQCIWMERGAHWAITDYAWRDVFAVLGRKDRARFGRDLGWVRGPDALPDEFRFDSRPQFVRTENGARLLMPARGDVVVRATAEIAYDDR